MTILLAGGQDILDRLEPLILEAGLDTSGRTGLDTSGKVDLVRVSDPARLGTVNGKPGEFTCRLDGAVREIGAIVLIGETTLDPFLSNETAFLQGLAKLPFSEPLAIVMDGGGQSSLSALALRRASQAVARKKQAVIFARDIRTADPEAETLYREARQAGVQIVKYRTVTMTSDDGMVEVRAEGDDPEGIGTTVVRTRRALDASCARAAGTEEFARKFRLKEKTGSDTAGRYWLYPAFTSRRGVYFIDVSLIPKEKLGAAIRSVLADAVSAARGEPAAGYAEVDPAACAFCYTCYRACPHAALVPDEAAAAMTVIRESCEGCGICVAICPADAIELKAADGLKPAARMTGAGTSGTAVSADAPPAMRVGAGSGALKIIACENSAYHAALMVIGNEPEKRGIGLESVPCCGSVNGARIARELESFDAVLVAACVEEACRHFDGNVRGCLHAKRLVDNMSRLGLTGKVRFCNASAVMTGAMREEIDAMTGRAGAGNGAMTAGSKPAGGKEVSE